MATVITPAINSAGGAIVPTLVIDYGYELGSRNIVLESLGSGFPSVFLRDAQSRAGTLSLLFTAAATSLDAADRLGRADRFHFLETDVGEDFHFIVTGAIRRTNTPGTDAWIVNVPFREVEAL